MIIADENIFDVIIQALESEGYDVLSIKNSSFRGISDYDVVNLSINPPKIIITEDKDFGDIVFPENKKVPDQKLSKNFFYIKNGSLLNL